MRNRIALALLLLAPALAGAQSRWKSIGTTSSGNTVFVDQRSVKRAGSLVSADVRVLFTTPVQTGRGAMASTRTSTTFDCARQTFAVRENVMYSDARGSKVIERRVNKIPGYGPALDGSPSAAAMKFLCAR